MASKITSKEWEKAVAHCQEMMNLASQKNEDGINNMYIFECKKMLNQYLMGKKTKSLFHAMKDLR